MRPAIVHLPFNPTHVGIKCEQSVRTLYLKWPGYCVKDKGY